MRKTHRSSHLRFCVIRGKSYLSQRWPMSRPLEGRARPSRASGADRPWPRRPRRAAREPYRYNGGLSSRGHRPIHRRRGLPLAEGWPVRPVNFISPMGLISPDRRASPAHGDVRGVVCVWEAYGRRSVEAASWRRPQRGPRARRASKRRRGLLSRARSSPPRRNVDDRAGRSQRSSAVGE